jgi:fructose-1,6-bisphosphatase I
LETFGAVVEIIWFATTYVQVFSSCLRSSGRTGIIASEEEDVLVAVEESYSGNYIVVFDPLDGSSNIDAAVSTGSIFGIYNPNDECLADIGDDPAVSPCILHTEI